MKNKNYLKATSLLRSLIMTVLLAITGLWTTNVNAQVSSYTFAQTSGTYTPISGGTQVAIGTAWDDGTITGIPLGFNFSFNSIVYSTISLNYNGFITPGNTLTQAYCPTTDATSNLNTIMGYATDLHGIVASSEIRYQTIGTSPNQTFVVQWTNVNHFSGAAGDNWTFQIRLNEGSNSVQVVWGPTVTATTNGANTCADANGESGGVGLTSGTGTNANLRVVLNGTTTWATSTSAVVPSTTNVCNMSTSNVPANGLTWTWSYPAAISGTSTALGGLWSNAATWVGGTIPVFGGDATIADGAVVTVDQVVGVNNLTVGQGTSGVLQWNATANAFNASGNVTVNSGAKFLPYTTTANATTGVTVNVGGNFANNGYCNFTAGSTTSALLNFNGSGSTLSGTGTFEGNASYGIIRSLGFQNLGSNTISTSQNIATYNFILTAGSLNTNGKLRIDNTAECYGRPINTAVSSANTTAMGSLYNAAPVVFGTAVTPWVSGTQVLGTRYFTGGNVFLCTTGGASGANAPTVGTFPIQPSGSTAVYLYLGAVGTLGNPFALAAGAAGTQYFVGNKLYTCILAGTANTAAGIDALTTGAGSQTAGGTSAYIYVGSPAVVSVNYDGTAQNVRGLNVTSGGSGYSSSTAPALTFSLGIAGGTGSGAAATPVIEYSGGIAPANSATQKSGVATITNGLVINSDQGVTPTLSTDEKASTGVGALSTTGGGVNYTNIPLVGFAGPTQLNLVTDAGSGYTTAPTVTVTGGNLITGSALTSGNFLVSVNNGRVEWVSLATGTTATYSTPPTIALSGGNATIAWPTGCWPAATPVIGSNGQILSFAMNNSGYGYVAAPTVGIGTTSGAAGSNGGTFTTVATAPTARIGQYQLILNFFSPATSAVAQADVAVIPPNRKMTALQLNGNGNGLNLTSNLTLFGTTPLALVASLSSPGNILDLGTNNLLFANNAYGGLTTSTFNSGGANTYIKNGSITMTGRGGGSTFNYPFAGNTTSGYLIWGAGSTPTAVTTGSTATRVTVTEILGVPGNTNGGTGASTGNRSYRVQLGTLPGGYAAQTGLNPTITLHFNTIDALTTLQNNTFVSEASAASGPWTIKSAAYTASATALPAAGFLATSTAAPGPITAGTDQYYAFSKLATVVSSFSPSNSCGGGQVIITGVAFTGATAVTFGGTPALSFIVNSSTSITAVVSNSGSTGLVSVTTPAGTGTSATTFTFNGVGPVVSIQEGSNIGICPSASTTLTALPTGGGETYLWSANAGSATTQQVTVSAAGTYTCTVTNTLGCSNAISATVFINSVPALTLTQNPPTALCSGNSATLTGAAIIGGPGTGTIGTATTSIGGNDGNPYRSGNGNGNQIRTQLLYTAAELTAAGLTSGPITSIGFTTQLASTGTLSNLSIALGATAVSALTTTYQTTPVTTVFTQASFTPLGAGLNTHVFNAGTFTWNGTDNILVNVCQTNSVSGTATVSAFTPAFASNVHTANSTTSCTSLTGTAVAAKPMATFGGTVGTNISGSLTWLWQPGSLSGPTQLVSPGTSTTYTVTATNSGGCTNSGTISVTVIPTPSAPTISGNLIVCGQATTLLTSTAPGSGNSIQWFDAPAPGGILVFTGTAFTTPVLTANKTYYVQETGSSCSSTRTPVTVTWNAPPALAIYNDGNNSTSDYSFCGQVGVPVVGLNANTASASSWAANGSTYSWTQTNPGGLSCTGSCGATNSVNLNNILPANNNEHIIVTVTDPVLNCVASVAVDITAFNFAAFTASANPSSICGGSSSVLSSGVSASNFSAACKTSPPSTLTTLLNTPVVLTSGGTAVTALSGGSLDDGYWNAIPIGFTFSYFGTNYTTLNVGTNGNANFGATGTTQFSFVGGFPSTGNPANTIAICARDLQLGSTGGNFAFGTGTVQYSTEGFSPNRKFIIQYINCATWYSTNATDGFSTVELVLYETTGVLDINVIKASNPAATTGTFINDTRNKYIGLQDGTKTIGATAPNCATSVANYWNGVADEILAPQAWRFSPPITYTFSWTSTPAGFTSTSGSPTVTPSVNTQYNLVVTDPVTGCTKTDAVSVSVVSTSAPTTTGATRCGVGTVNLSATGTGLNWFQSSSVAGPIINTGNTYNPSVSSTTTYYVVADPNSVVQSVGPLVTLAGTTAYASATSNYQTFDVLSNNGVIISTVDFRANAATPVNTPITVQLENSSGTPLGTATALVASPGNIQTMTLNFFVPQGTGYHLKPIQNPNLQYHQDGFTNPYTIPGQVSITGWDGGTTLFVFFYNWSVRTGCFSTVSPVTATVTTAPTLTITPSGSTSYCGTGSVGLTAGGTGYVNFSWSPATGLSGTTGATVTANPSVTTTYTVLADDGAGPGGCANTQTVTITVNGPPFATATASSSPICQGATSTLGGNGGSSSVKQVGLSENPSDNTIAVYDCFNSNVKTQVLYTAAELNAAGLFGPSNLTSIAFKVANKLSTGSLSGFTIKIAQVASAPPLTTTYLTPTLTTVFTGTVATTLGWNTHIFSTPFPWNGTSNILIEICNGVPSAQGFDQIFSTPTASFQTILANLLGCASTTGNAILNRPNTRFTGGSVNYSWSPATNLSASNIENPVFTGNSTGSFPYSVLVTDPANGCTATSSVTIGVIPPPSGGTVAGPATGCSGVALSAITETGGNGSYQWQVDINGAGFNDISGQTASTLTYTPLVDGSHVFRCKRSVSGCSDDFSTVTITVTVNQTPVASASANLGSICPGGAVNLSGGGGLSTVLVSQDFESGLGSWTTVNNTTGGSNSAAPAWTLQPHPYTYAGDGTVFDSPGGTQFLLSNSDEGGSGNNTNVILQSPSFSTIGMTGITLSFRHFYQYWASGDVNTAVEVSTNGSTWTIIKDYKPDAVDVGDPAAFASASLNLNAYAGNPTVYVRFRYLTVWGYYWAIDDISVVGSSLSGTTYGWTSTPAGFTSSLQNAVANPSVPTSYTFTVTNGGCISTATTATIGINPLPDALASSNAPVCAGFPLSLFGTNNDGSQVNTGWSWSGPSFTSTSQNPNISNASGANSGTYTLTITNSFGCTATSSTDVTVNPNPVLSIGTQTNVSCNGLSDGSVDLDATNGTAPYLFDLVGPSTPDGIFTGLAAGTYTATVNDDNGCAATSLTVTITEPDVLTVSAGSNTPVCSGTSLNLGATPTGGTATYSYAWTGPNGPVPAVQNPTIASATTADAGQYDVLITDAHGCTSTGSHTVQVNAAPTAAIALSGSPNKCLGQSATVILTFTGTGPWNYTITGNGGPYTGSTSSNPASVNVTPIAGGVHTYTITAVGNTSCPTGGTTSGSATVNVSTVPPPSSGPVPAGAAEACVGSVMLITSNVITGQNIIYSWNTGSNSSTVLFSTNIGGPFTAGPFQTNTNQVYVQFGALAGGQSGYQVCLQGVNGCGSSINKCLWIRGVVSGPGAITPANQVVACPNDVKSYSCGTSAGASVYSWTLSGSATPITSGQGTTNVQVTFPPAFVSGQLCVTAALACGGSSTSPARCMSISKTPANANVPTGAATVCPGATGVSYSIPAVAGATGYNWTVPANATIATGTNSPSITVNFPTPYNGTSTVCVTTTSACGTSAVKCKNVASGIPNQPAGITGPLTNVCGSTVQYSVVNPIASAYTWTNPAGTTISGSATGSTILLNVSSTFTSGVLTVAANSTLCPPATSATRTSSTIWGRPNNPGAITANPSVWCSGGFVNFFVTAASPLPAYNWTVSNGTIDAGQGSSIIDVTWGATAAGTVSVNASNTCGQSAGTSSQSFSAGCREEGTSSATAFSVYPNPAHDKVTVSIDVKEQTGFNLELRDMSGRVILSEDREGAAGINAYELDLKGFAKGIYMLEVQSADDKWKTKVIIE